MQTADLITRKLTEAFEPQSLKVEDESHQHAGHAGHRPGGQTHFRVYIVADAFKGKTRIERHRMINATLSRELAGGVRPPPGRRDGGPDGWRLRELSATGPRPAGAGHQSPW